VKRVRPDGQAGPPVIRIGRDRSILAQGLEKSPMSAPSEFGLFLAVLFGMGLHGVIRVAPRVNNMTPCGMSMVCRLFMVSRLMMLGGFRMVTRGVRKVL
jgi:hypothetical protein